LFVLIEALNAFLFILSSVNCSVTPSWFFCVNEGVVFALWFLAIVQHKLEVVVMILLKMTNKIFSFLTISASFSHERTVKLM